MDPIYLDHNATTPVLPEVVEAMASCQDAGYANPASQHRPGQEARRLLEEARETIAEILGADLSPPRRDRVVLTSGGTEANNLAILGLALADDSPPGQIIVSAGEHQSVLGPAERLLELGWRLDALGLAPDGVVQLDMLASLLSADDDLARSRRLVSLQLANHETGVLQPVARAAELCRRADVPLHTDAVQAAGKLSLSFRDLGVAAMTVSAHKFGGPAGIGAVVLCDGLAIRPLMFGGHQQSGLRPGTESVPLAVGMATALELCRQRQEETARRLVRLRDRFEQSLAAALPEVVVHGQRAPRLPQTSNVGFPGVDGEVLRIALDLAGVACSVGAACESGATELSPTLRAMNLPDGLAASSLRFSLGATTTEANVNQAIQTIARVRREISP